MLPLREQGVLIFGSGNITHNLMHAMRWDGREQPSWAVRFDADIARALEQRDVGFLTRALDSDTGRRAHPSPDHYLPLLYVVGAGGAASSVRFPLIGFDLGSLSMRSVVLA
jgi:4,5-DOPA dioxygenase extradiol